MTLERIAELIDDYAHRVAEGYSPDAEYRDLLATAEREAELREALRWYVDHDETNDESGNDYYIAGKRLAIAALNNERHRMIDLDAIEVAVKAEADARKAWKDVDGYADQDDEANRIIDEYVRASSHRVRTVTPEVMLAVCDELRRLRAENSMMRKLCEESFTAIEALGGLSAYLLGHDRFDDQLLDALRTARKAVSECPICSA